MSTLVLALLTPLTSQVELVDGPDQAINHRVDRVRFLSRLPLGGLVRTSVELLSARQRPHGFLEVVIGVTMEDTGGAVVCTAEQTLYAGPQDAAEVGA